MQTFRWTVCVFGALAALRSVRPQRARGMLAMRLPRASACSRRTRGAHAMRLDTTAMRCGVSMVCFSVSQRIRGVPAARLWRCAWCGRMPMEIALVVLRNQAFWIKCRFLARMRQLYSLGMPQVFSWFEKA